MAMYLMCSSKKGISAHQLHRTLGVTYKTAWFMAHRIRLAMMQEPIAGLLEGTVEADETYVGGKERTSTLTNELREHKAEAKRQRLPYSLWLLAVVSYVPERLTMFQHRL